MATESPAPIAKTTALVIKHPAPVAKVASLATGL